MRQMFIFLSYNRWGVSRSKLIRWFHSAGDLGLFHLDALSYSKIAATAPTISSVFQPGGRRKRKWREGPFCLRLCLGMSHTSLLLLSLLLLFTYSVKSSSLQPHGPQPSRLVCPWDFPSKNTGVDCHFLLRAASWPRDWKFVSSTSPVLQVDFSPLSHQDLHPFNQNLATWQPLAMEDSGKCNL